MISKHQKKYESFNTKTCQAFPLPEKNRFWNGNSRYIDDILKLNNVYFVKMVKEIYSKGL